MKNITKEDWKKLVKETDNAVVIDVRTPEEWAEGIQPNAKQINFLSLVDFLSEIEDKKSSLAIISKKLDDLIKTNFSQQD